MTTFSISRLIRILAVILGVIFTVSLILQFIAVTTGRARLLGLTPFFNMDGDEGFPTWYNSFLLLLLAGVCQWVGTHPLSAQHGFRGRWNFLAGIFLLMSVDEVATIHEQIGLTMSRFHDFDGVFTYPFILVGVLLAVILFLNYLPFLKKLPRRVSWMMCLAGFIYLLGAAGAEGVCAYIFSEGREKTFAYVLAAHIEELLEMSGLILFLRCLLQHRLVLDTEEPHPLQVRLIP